MMPGQSGVTIVRRIMAEPAKVWAADTRLERMMQWWGPEAGPTLSFVADILDRLFRRTGGHHLLLSHRRSLV